MEKENSKPKMKMDIFEVKLNQNQIITDNDKSSGHRPPLSSFLDTFENDYGTEDNIMLTNSPKIIDKRNQVNLTDNSQFSYKVENQEN